MTEADVFTHVNATQLCRQAEEIFRKHCVCAMNRQITISVKKV